MNVVSNCWIEPGWADFGNQGQTTKSGTTHTTGFRTQRGRRQISGASAGIANNQSAGQKTQPDTRVPAQLGNLLHTGSLARAAALDWAAGHGPVSFPKLVLFGSSSSLQSRPVASVSCFVNTVVRSDFVLLLMRGPRPMCHNAFVPLCKLPARGLPLCHCATPVCSCSVLSANSILAQRLGPKPSKA